MNEFEKIGSKIKAARLAAGMTQKELGDKAGYTFSTISRIEKGEIDLPISKVKTFSNVLHVPVDYIIGDFLVEETETPEEMFARLDDNVRSELIKEMLDIMKQKEAKKWQQQNGTGKDGESEFVSTVKSGLFQIQRQGEEAAKMSNDELQSVGNSLTSYRSMLRGEDTSKKSKP